MKNLLIKLGLWEEKKGMTLAVTDGEMLNGKVIVDEGWYTTAMKHYCGTCEQWFKTASVASHNRFKHKDA